MSIASCTNLIYPGSSVWKFGMSGCWVGEVTLPNESFGNCRKKRARKDVNQHILLCFCTGNIKNMQDSSWHLMIVGLVQPKASPLVQDNNFMISFGAEFMNGCMRLVRMAEVTCIFLQWRTYIEFTWVVAPGQNWSMYRFQGSWCRGKQFAARPRTVAPRQNWNHHRDEWGLGVCPTCLNLSLHIYLKIGPHM